MRGVEYMKEYLVEITEISQKQVTIKAHSKEDAVAKIRQQYHNQDIILDETNFIETEFSVLKEQKIKSHRER